MWQPGASYKGLKTILSKHKGAFSEHIAVAWLLEQGFEVFRNVSQHGEVDLLALDSEGNVSKVDVKTYSVNKNGYERYHPNSKCVCAMHQKGIKVLCVNTKTRECRWVN